MKRNKIFMIAAIMLFTLAAVVYSNLTTPAENASCTASCNCGDGGSVSCTGTICSTLSEDGKCYAVKCNIVYAYCGGGFC